MHSLSHENNLRYLSSWTLFEIKGQDSERFLNGQLTNDVKALSNGEAHLTARVNRTGNLLFFGYLIRKNSEAYLFLCPSEFKNGLIEDLNKFIIMDEVVIETEGIEYSLSFNPLNIIKTPFKFVFMGAPVGLILASCDLELNEETFNEMMFQFGIPNIEKILSSKLLINQTSLVDTAVSDSKGCYIGQETIRKIENNRGAATKEIAIFLPKEKLDYFEHIKIDNVQYKAESISHDKNGTYIKIAGRREIRVLNKLVTVEIDQDKIEGTVIHFPFTELGTEFVSQRLFENGIELFVEDKDDQGRAYLELALFFCPYNTEFLEALGALEGRLGNYDKAIELMNKLEEIDPSSVMACTNKSLFLMKQGKIEQAEEEKAKATLKSFGGGQTQGEEEKKKELQKRLEMYLQVLEIDIDDEMANQGAAQIYFDLGDLKNSKENVQRLLDINEENEKALSLSAKTLILEGHNERAKKVLEKVISISSAKGDFVLANELQSLISSLTIPT